VRFERFRPSSFLLGKDISMMRMREWMNDCSSNHVACSEKMNAQNDSNRPARLLDLASTVQTGHNGIRLAQTESGVTYQYACLSHRWDEAVHAHRTTRENLTENQDLITLDNLPQNFRDAISIARNLDIRYL